MVKRWRVAVVLLPVLLVGLFFAIDLLGAGCSGDLLDDPNYSCNLGGEIEWAMWIAVPVSVGAALVALVAWPRRR